MKDSPPLLLLLIAGGMSQIAFFQASVYGFYSTYTAPTNPIVLGQYEAISGEWMEWDASAFTSGIVMGSSAFDAGTESFMFAGVKVPQNAYSMNLEKWFLIGQQVPMFMQRRDQMKPTSSPRKWAGQSGLWCNTDSGQRLPVFQVQSYASEVLAEM